MKLDEIEHNNNNGILSTFCKFSSEKIVMRNATFDEIIYPEHSFTIVCAFQFHNNSSIYHENIRKIIHFLLLPDKRTLFEVNQKDAIPTDCIFNSEHFSPIFKL